MGLLSMKGICKEVGEAHLVPSLYCGIGYPASPWDHAGAWSLAQMTTSLYTSLSHASLWGSSVTPRAHVAHYVRMIQPRASASRCDPSVPEWAFLLDCNSLEGLDSAAPDEESLNAFWGL